ncbi:hypothetical protein NDU88_004538 [Pleurodeles waltl]|uniref:Uncharacterized protein n=1 Tax=Pleurodeles waltl TaxID=8319 RepID=A0AAV7LM12_PLEWA|nr:hypothetical protein NDU88_004538 [Pleurodeles waltl]
MARVAGERTLAFNSKEFEKLVDGVLPLYVKLYGWPEVQCPSEEGTKAGHRQGGADPGGLQPAEHPLQEAVGGPAVLGKEDLRGPAGEVLPRGRGAHQALTPLMRRILVVVYPDLDGRLKAEQQSQGGEYRNHTLAS